MDFRLLHTRLVSHVRARVRNGEISERSLARLTGISQPHVHNVLKGARLLSTDMADQILQRLRIDLVQLLTASQDGATHRAPPDPESADPDKCQMVHLLDGRIGLEYPYPKATGRDRYPFPTADAERLDSPVAARLVPDRIGPLIFAGGGVVLLDRSQRARTALDEEGYFALDLSPGGTIGLVRRVGRHLYLWARHAEAWESIPLRNRDPLDVIQGRVSLLVRHL